MPKTDANSLPSGLVKIFYSDEIHLRPKQISWKNRGLELETKWTFSRGAEIEFGLECEKGLHRCVGLVVDCQPHPRKVGYFTVTLFLGDEPCQKMREMWTQKSD